MIPTAYSICKPTPRSFNSFNWSMWLKLSLHADWYVAILKNNGRHLEFSNDQLRKSETSTETPFLKGSCVYHYVHDCYYILRLSARQNIFCSLRKNNIILISLVSIMWQKNAHVSLFILFYLYFFVYCRWRCYESFDTK